MRRVLFVCVQNAGRSQIAQALFERTADGRHEARSAGSRPAEQVHPEVVEVMQELGIDVAGRTPRLLDHADLEWADNVVTMGCGDECPVVPGKRYEDWELPDPAGRPLEEVRAIRDEIAERVGSLVSELDRAGEKVDSAPQEPRIRPHT
jgi:arsenate reductase (thioredoxin)